MTPPDRRVARITCSVGLLLFLLVAALLVPWGVVPGGAVAPVPAATVFTPEQVARAERFAHWARLWSYLSLALSLIVACWFGLGARGRRLVERLPGPWWLRVPLAVAALALAGRLVTVPCSVVLQRLRLDYGLTTQAWSAYTADLVTSEIVTIVLTSVAMIFVVGCARRWTRAWPAVVGGLLAALVVVGSFVYPLVLEPLFNNFEPLPDGTLRTQILALADEEGVQIDDVLVADASRRTTTLNAYVSGFGSTRRVVVYDNLLTGVSDDEILSVVAHELSHARHDDVLVGTALGAAGCLVGVGLLALLLAALRRRGHAGAGDAAVVPLVLALSALATFAVAPVQNAISRQLETRADVDAVRTTGDVPGFVELQRQLALRSLADPTPPALSVFWFGSHPTALTRIAIAQRVAE
ncbi:M48 family metallopeptidase [soil metagenome]